ncbi:alkaline phosphatase family protein [Subsaximicrobium wynnwilliamsii]|uniref:Alkaline phosphatase family protein n=1 Tax=Subsaximicrobium wynnwilliamsii TaxID=291179 RepID=A0A5C6ZMK7_9FLAO|nr:alkaline phosphatase D family protein [Subsaximicrobium wynnwilliamsii]TXD84870.1 alkaline phosphatase family protein [Subsaximicrobium wynnwilliamsii]TXD90541.1 alkaline phosphatase family protein [Subsaximicrobium wynnwilliamsii]TXE05016.1 alkaline phosphatase family protein [Subsaximicrobium wynnwilliamsii]
MIRYCSIFLLFLSIYACKTRDNISKSESEDLVIAFGSCNKQYEPNLLWDDVLSNKPKVWVWGGDVVYSDTEDMAVLEKSYTMQHSQEAYQLAESEMRILGTWDDHDYGKNDAGAGYPKKNESQQLFLDFLNVPKTDARRDREGVYHSELITTPKGSVKLIILDTRFFRTALTDANVKGKRYVPNTYGEGTVLGEQQWQWLQKELENSLADFNVIVSSIQFLSSEHGFETWGNFPHEVDKMLKTIVASKAKNVLLTSGDRHISEFSKRTVKGLSYPIIDFTSSGLTHAYSSFDGEPNRFRSGKVVSEISFGVLKFNFSSKTVTMQMRGDGNTLQQELIQRY